MSTVVITGAARGIGRATAEAFLDRGWAVHACDVRPPDITGATNLALDVTQPDQWESALAGIGVIGALVNNAGILSAGDFESIPAARQAAIIDVNTKGVLFGCHAAFPYLTSGSVVVNLASASAFYGTPSLATYSSTKAFVSALTEALDLEWERHGIRVLDLHPLFVDTPMGADALHTASGQRMGIHTSPQDVAQAVVRAVTRPGSRHRGPHRGVGLVDKGLGAGNRIAPQAVLRAVMGRLGR